MKKPFENQENQSNQENQQADPAQQAQPLPDENLAKIAELTNDLQRTRADFENFRKQIEIQKENEKSAARLATVCKFLTLLDDIDRAFIAYPEQLAPLQKSFAKTLSELKLEKLISTPGTEFNPDFHNAVLVEDGDGEQEIIAGTLQNGYLYEGKVLRPAMVRVKKA